MKSPEEYIADLTKEQLLYRIKPSTQYDRWSIPKKEKISNYMGWRFGMEPEDAEAIARDLSRFGYSSGGSLS